MTTDNALRDLIGDQPVRFWTCLNRAHETVTWADNVATCDTCGLTSNDTARYQRTVREDERKRIARRIEDFHRNGEWSPGASHAFGMAAGLALRAPAEFIAHARADVPALVAKVRDL